MPVVDDPARAARRLLLDAAGEPVGALRARRARRPAARRPARARRRRATPERAVAVADGRAAAAGASRPPSRSAASSSSPAPARGATPTSMSRDLTRDPAPGELARAEAARPAMRLTPVDRPAIDLAPALLAAFPPEHPDHADIRDPEQPEVELDELLSGRLMGPLLRCSALAVAGGRRRGRRGPGQRQAGRAAVRRPVDLAGVPPSRRARASAARCSSARSRSPRATGCRRSGSP